MSKVRYLCKYFVKAMENTTSNIRSGIHDMKSIPLSDRKENKWFKKSALILATNTKINTQKSFWRLNLNTNTSGLPFNAGIIMKLRKMYQHVRKYYELNMFRSFFMIDKYGKGGYDQSAISRGVAEFAREYHNQRQNEESMVMSEPQAVSEVVAVHADASLQNSRKVSLGIMERLFRGSLSKQIRKWEVNAIPEKKLQIIQQQIRGKDRSDYDYVARVGALESLAKLHQSVVYRSKIKGFRLLLQNYFYRRSETEHDDSLNERLELLNRQAVLMEEIRSSKNENELLQGEIDLKDRSLKEANDTVTILSLRINYMITQKFTNMVEKVFETVEYRHLNDSFDALIDEANAKFEMDDNDIF